MSDNTLNKSDKEFIEEESIVDYNFNIIDIQNISTKFITESTTEMNTLYATNNLYPIYIVLSFSDTTFGYVERFLEKVKYSHSGISLDSNLKNIYTYAFNKQNNGFNIENLHNYVSNSSKAIIGVFAIFVDKSVKDKITDTINNFKKNIKRTNYNFKNLINVLANKPASSNSLSLICSQFVDVVLKTADINITNKKSNLVIPQDFAIKNNPRIYKLYEGLARKYDENKVEENIATLFNLGAVSGIKRR